MESATLVPSSLTDSNTNVSSGAYTDVDSTVDDADGNVITSVANAWTGGTGTGSAFSFGLTDVPGAADNISSIKLRARARLINTSDDFNDITVDISGTNAPSNKLSYDNTVTSLTNKSTGDIATSASASDINGWTVRVYQSGFLQEGTADGSQLELDEVEVVVNYSTSTPAGEPSTFSESRFERLSRNPQIARIPQTQDQWNRFIYELNSVLRNEVLGFEPVLTGFSTDPTNPFCWYQRFGQLVYMEFAFGSGTSNATTFTITNLPESITPSAQQRCIVQGIMEDAGVDQSYGSSALVSENGTIAFYPGANSNGAWTASGNKGFSMPSGQYASITYMLRNPNKQ